MIYSVIMAGGSGTRFWPQSRQAMPKQLLRLSGQRTLIQSAYDRCVPTIPAERVWVVTNALQAAEIGRQLPEIPADQLLQEPCGRNTAPCIGLAAIHLLQRDPEATMAVMPADHVIAPQEQFRQALQQAASLIADDEERLILFGVKPNYAATGFGYIERGEAIEGRAYRVDSFREKPTQDTAEEYLRAGTFYWNCGIFVWKAQTIVNALREFEPEIFSRLEKLAGYLGTEGFDAALQVEFPQMKSISIDYAVLERAARICVLEAPFDWDDVGSWPALERLNEQDADGNTIDGLHCAIQTSGCIIRSTPDHLIATYGLEDFVVVHTPDATLIAPKNDENAVREIVSRLGQAGYERFL